MSSISLLGKPCEPRIHRLLKAAFYRSFSARQMIDKHDNDNHELPPILAYINPSDSHFNTIKGELNHGRKIIIFGHIGDNIADLAGIRRVGPFTIQPESFNWVDHSSFIATNHYIQYHENSLVADINYFRRRFFCRFDAEDEWNNHGYGKIAMPEGIWSISQIVDNVSAEPVAWVKATNHTISLYASIMDYPDASIMWLNREVGPVDSLEWCLIENFLAHYRSDALVCLPVLSEIPFGYDGAVTMHVDCDEAISSAEPLHRLYQRYGIPISLAVKTGQDVSSDDIDFMKSVLARGGAVASHSVNHLPNWGGDYATALNEARDSKEWLETQVTDGKPIKYAVSPFYQNPPYAVNAMADAGYTGFISGIIFNDPEYLMGRAGIVPFTRRPIISHSQQCMLHGDCFHRYGNNIDPYIESFDNHLAAKTIFGYLDHPFSPRYWYGWTNEEERLEAHERFIIHMKRAGHIWFCNLDECLGFIDRRNQVKIWLDDSGVLHGRVPESVSPLQFAVRWKGREIPI